MKDVKGVKDVKVSRWALALGVAASVAVIPVASAPPAQASLSVVLIVDVTASQPLRRSEIHTAIATHWIPSLRPGDRARVGVLSDPLTLSAVLPDDPRAAAATARTTIDRGIAEPTRLWDATDAAIQSLVGAPGRRAVVLLTDGRANANVIGLREVAARAVAAHVSISSVSEASEALVPQAGGPAVPVRPDAALETLAKETGGVFLEDGIARRTLTPRMDPFAYVRELVRTPNQPGPLLAEIMSRLRTARPQG